MTSGEDPAVVLMEDIERFATAQSALLSVMANRHRLHILFLLSEREYYVGDLMRELHESPVAVSRHLTILRENNIIRASRRGQTVCYSLISERAAQLIKVVAEIYCHEDDEEVAV